MSLVNVTPTPHPTQQPHHSITPIFTTNPHHFACPQALMLIPLHIFFYQNDVTNQDTGSGAMPFISKV